eukprot:CAMPEP_0174700632 /NCGR_PEP_ID=MMETSP1094-20130205/5529_1 /TAXON_ID=156173 /ORGANISM="Chrysochromulina brevifilum, Strain UTEX LB 985" /LENGTH=59 /DNA_ID=CAMNT_0015898145 /DNA_START=464 /DNA_END=640 /DNA_ORIENTATION=-
MPPSTPSAWQVSGGGAEKPRMVFFDFGGKRIMESATTNCSWTRTSSHAPPSAPRTHPSS